MSNSGVENNLMFRLQRICQRLEAHFIDEADHLDITPRQLLVLAAASGVSGASQADLADRTGVDRSTMAEIVARLSKKGLLTRHKSEIDGRAYEVFITEAGEKVLEEASLTARRAEEMFLDSFPSHDRAHLLALCQSRASR